MATGTAVRALICGVCGEPGNRAHHVQFVDGLPAHKACRPKPERTCTTSGCENDQHSTGLCQAHYNKAYYAKDPEGQRERARQWALRNPEKVKARNAARDKSDGRARAKAYYWQDRVAGVARAANNKARRLGVAGRLTADGIRARFAYFADNCWVCGLPGADSIDHVKPLNKGGLNIHANIRPAHLGCNAARSWEGRR